jgi:hypothetical protein
MDRPRTKNGHASLVDLNRASAPPTASRLVEAKNAVPFLQ